MYLDSKTMDKKILDGQSQNNGTVRLCEEHLRQGGSQGVDLVVPAATLQEEAVPASVWGPPRRGTNLFIFGGLEIHTWARRRNIFCHVQDLRSSFRNLIGVQL
jgi:hypothetical protein